MYLKKYFTEGLIQMAILLSLCGVRVDVGLEPYLSPSWHEIILGPTSALTQTQFHNLRNRLEDGHTLHPKNVDLDGFFTARRLLGWVHSLDRLQVPHTELETWLVQRESDPLPMGYPDQTSPLVRTPAGVERDRTAPRIESRAALGTAHQEEEEEEEDKEEGTHHALHQSDVPNERGEDEEEEDLVGMHRHCRRTEGGGRPELTQNEDQTSFSFQECLRLLEETFPFTEEQQLHDAGGRGGDMAHQTPNTELMLPSIIPTENSSLDLELHWQDLLAIMEPEDTDINMMTSLGHTTNSRATGPLQAVGSRAPQQSCNNHDDEVAETSQEVLLMESPVQHGMLEAPNQSELETALFPLIPSAELDDHSSVLNTRDTLKNSDVNSLHSPPDHTDLLAEDLAEDFSLGVNPGDNSSNYNINFLSHVDTMEGSLSSEYALYPENPPNFDVNFHSHDLTSSFTSSLFNEEDVEDEDSLASPLNDLLEDAAILDEIRLLDLALEEGFSPEMAARLDEEGYLYREIAQQETGNDNDHSDSSIMVTEDQDQPRRQQQDSENEEDSDSGLSLDFSHSHASPCASEASSYSSSSTTSSCVSDEESPFSESEDDDAKEDLLGPDMKVEMTIKQEELEEEELGAVGGGYPEDVKKHFSPNYRDDKLFDGFPWVEHIGHDHTYNQPWSSASFPSLGKMPTKQTKSSLRHDSAKPYHRSRSGHISETKMWNRDERRARALKVPFSNELIVNMPVEEFNDLLANFHLSEEQLNLIRDIRRRGKNKIAAQNCRKRKMDVLLGLNDDVSSLMRYRSRLLRERQEALRNLQEMKRQLGMLYQEVFSRLRDEEGRPLDTMEYLLNFEPNGGVTVASRQQKAALPLTKASKKQKDKKK
uniref:endoplasmic reticulum membrane sensor NFE2L1a isoform X2 n=1 Tax=Scatophagus argus TaxID=75038 RepID=UPI001ED80E0C|nr:endoplasmic reticulum membrane sensor NFE2L1a isoform X2 [Scatophagus argus]